MAASVSQTQDEEDRLRKRDQDLEIRLQEYLDKKLALTEGDLVELKELRKIQSDNQENNFNRFALLMYQVQTLFDDAALVQLLNVNYDYLKQLAKTSVWAFFRKRAFELNQLFKKPKNPWAHYTWSETDRQDIDRLSEILAAQAYTKILAKRQDLLAIQYEKCTSKIKENELNQREWNACQTYLNDYNALSQRTLALQNTLTQCTTTAQANALKQSAYNRQRQLIVAVKNIVK